MNGLAGDIFDYGPNSGYIGYMPTVSAVFSLIGNNTGSPFAEANPGPDIDGNIVGDPAGVGVVDALLDPLADNGGDTLTHLPMTGSPAIDAGNPAISGLDQRGGTRPSGAGTDMGSVEADAGFSLNLDFNNDGMYNCVDMNLLEAAIDSGTFNAAFDVNMDMALTSADVFAWLSDAGACDLVRVVPSCRVTRISTGGRRWRLRYLECE